MKITDITAYPVWAGHRNFLFVVVDTDEGIYGVGESGLTSREQAVMGAFQDFKDVLVGQDPFRIEHIWQLLFRGGFFPAPARGELVPESLPLTLPSGHPKGKPWGANYYGLLGGASATKWSVTPKPGHGSWPASKASETRQGGWKVVRWLAPAGDILGTGATGENGHSPV